MRRTPLTTTPRRAVREDATKSTLIERDKQALDPRLRAPAAWHHLIDDSDRSRVCAAVLGRRNECAPSV